MNFRNIGSDFNNHFIDGTLNSINFNIIANKLFYLVGKFLIVIRSIFHFYV